MPPEQEWKVLRLALSSGGARWERAVHCGQGNQHSRRKSAPYRQQVRRKCAAYERHIQISDRDMAA